MDPDLLELQHIAICQDILAELEPRGISDYNVVERLIEFCKSSETIDNFV